MQQRDALKSFFKRERTIGEGVGGVGGIELRARGESVAQLGAQQAQHVLVDGGLFHLAGLHRGNEILRVHEFGAGHLEIEPVVAGGDAVVGRVPVGHENALESPLAFEHLEIEKVVLRGVDAVDQVVGVHDSVDVGLGDGSFEGGQIDFAHGALVHVGAGVVAIELLIVERVVLHGGDYALGLHAFNERDDHRGVEVRILRQVLEVAAVNRRARDVDAGAEQEVDVARAGVAAEGCADFARQIGVPTGGKRRAAGISGGRSPGAHADRSIGHLEARQVDCGHGARVHAVDAAEQLDLLLQREFGKHGVSLGLNSR